jgi:hypothetical protein
MVTLYALASVATAYSKYLTAAVVNGLHKVAISKAAEATWLFLKQCIHRLAAREMTTPRNGKFTASYPGTFSPCATTGSCRSMPPTSRWLYASLSRTDFSPTKLPGVCPALETSSRWPGSHRSGSSKIATTRPLQDPDARRPAAARTPPSAATMLPPPSPRSVKSSTASLRSASNNIRTSTSPSGSRRCRCSSTLCSLSSSRMSSLSFSCTTISIKRSAIAVSAFPLPVAYFGHVLAVLVDVLLVHNQLVLKLALQAGAFFASLRQAVYDIHH